REAGQLANEGYAQFLEISVFDTGPGLAARWLADTGRVADINKLSLKCELDVVTECFKKHTTTKPTHYSGQGLTLALNAMRRLKAFMTLRTGRVSLYQDFSRSDTDEFRPN